MNQSDSSYQDTSSKVNPPLAESPGSPSLVLYGHTVAWTRQQKRCFQRLLSFIHEAIGRTCQLLRVDLTTAVGGDSSKLRRDYHELERRILRVFGYRIQSFLVETSEGNGVLHMVWAIKHHEAVWIGQRWLSKEWEKIHGAKIVFIKRMKQGQGDSYRVAKYLVSQYLSGQSAFVRYSWSWWATRIPLGRAWSEFKSITLRRGDMRLSWGGWASDRLRWIPVTFKEVIAGWTNLLLYGESLVGNMRFTIDGGRVVHEYVT